MFFSKISLHLFLITVLNTVLGSDVLDYSRGNFRRNVRKHDTILVVFFAPWCPHYKRLAPEYEKAAMKLKNNYPPVPLAKVDCTRKRGYRICDRNKIKYYPTLKVFKRGKFSTEYNLTLNAYGIVKYMRSQVGS